MAAYDAVYLRATIRLTPGRILWVSGAIANRMTPEESASLLLFVRRAEEEARRALLLFAGRKQAKKKLYGEVAREKDLALDAASGAVFTLLESFARVYPEGTAEGERVRRVRERLFPQSLEAVTNVGYADELGEVGRIVSMAKGELAADVAAVPGLEALIAVLEQRASEFALVVEREETSGPSFAEAKAAGEAAERRMAELVMAILIHHVGDEAHAAARRAALLEPYEVQQESMKQRFRRRLPVDEIDPATGEAVATEATELESAPRAAREPAE